MQEARARAREAAKNKKVKAEEEEEEEDVEAEMMPPPPPSSSLPLPNSISPGVHSNHSSHSGDMQSPPFHIQHPQINVRQKNWISQSQHNLL